MAWLAAMYVNHLADAAGPVVPVPAAVRRLGRRPTLDDPTEAEPVLAWLERIVDATRRDLPAIATESPPEHDSPMYHLAATSERLRDALDTVLRFGHLLTDLYTFSATANDGVVTLAVTPDPRWRGHRGLELLVEYETIGLWADARRLSPEAGWPMSMALPGDPPVVAYAERLRCPVTGGAAHAELRFPEAVLDVRLRAPNPTVRRFLEHQLAKRVADHASRGGPSAPSVEDRLRTHLWQVLPQDATAAACARALGMSERTLNRRLAEQDTTFRAVLDQVRYDLARTRLGHQSSDEVADALGYSDATAFRRAFRRWRRDAAVSA